MIATYIQPAIQLGNLRVDEPITSATDILFAGICFYAFLKINKRVATDRVKWYLKYYFLTLGLGAFLGGVLGHAFFYKLSPAWKLASWLPVILSVGLLVHATLELAKPLFNNRITKILGRLNLLVLAMAVFYTIRALSFPAVRFYTLFGMFAVVGSLSFFTYAKTKNRWAPWFILAIGLGALTALISGFGWGFGPWFNHNDISHVILSASALILYRGATLVLDTFESLDPLV